MHGEGVKITDVGGSSVYQAHLHLALDDAVAAYLVAHDAVARNPPLTEETSTPQLSLLYYERERCRVTALLLAACAVEATANLYLAQKTSAEQFAILESSRFVDKWTVIPTLFVSGYAFPRDGELYQDLRRLHICRNALVHLKEAVTRGGETVVPGSAPATGSDEHQFVARCQRLPDRLLDHVATFDKTDAIMSVRMALAIRPMIQELRRGVEALDRPVG